MQHVVQFYGREDQLLERNVGRYFAEGLDRAEAVLAIATGAHLCAFARQLRGHSQYQAAVRDGRLVLLDARAVLPAITVGGEPEWNRFDRTVGGALGTLRGQTGVGRIRAYGELVGLLWQVGRTSAAIRLEEYWNRLQERDGFDLYCAYPIDVLGSEFRTPVVAPILCTHTHVVSGNGALSGSLSRAMDEVLATEAVALWLHDHLSGRAEEILGRARLHQRV